MALEKQIEGKADLGSPDEKSNFKKLLSSLYSKDSEKEAVLLGSRSQGPPKKLGAQWRCDNRVRGFSSESQLWNKHSCYKWESSKAERWEKDDPDFFLSSATIVSHPCFPLETVHWTSAAKGAQETQLLGAAPVAHTEPGKRGTENRSENKRTKGQHNHQPQL